MKDNVLYPENYEEPEEAKPASPSRDEAAALAIIRAAVPKSGTPLPIEQVRKLVCGDQPLYQTEALGPDPSQDMAAAIVALKAGKPVRGPAATASFLPHEVDQLIAQVIEERRASWKPRPVAGVEAEVEVEKVKEKPE